MIKTSYPATTPQKFLAVRDVDVVPAGVVEERQSNLRANGESALRTSHLYSLLLGKEDSTSVDEAYVFVHEDALLPVRAGSSLSTGVLEITLKRESQ